MMPNWHANRQTLVLIRISRQLSTLNLVKHLVEREEDNAIMEI